MTHTVFLSLGSNLGDRSANLEVAIQRLPEDITVIKRSSIYETPPWGYEDQPVFLNMALQVETSFSPWRLIKNLKSIEEKMGRESSFRFGPRLIDLDILFYDDLIYDKDGLIIPHPRLAERAFVLVPLVEIAPDLLHPQLLRTSKELLGELDASGIKNYANASPATEGNMVKSMKVDHSLKMVEQEPSLRYKLEINILGLDDPASAAETVRGSKLVQILINKCIPGGKIPHHPYKKWVGGHWVLSLLADLGYPPGDEQLRPLVEQAYQWILGSDHARHIRKINGRIRRCASQEGNLVYSTLKLGLSDERTDELISRLITWQWQDGGWNCDKRPEVTVASFMESLIPLRALALAARLTGDQKTRASSLMASEIFLKRSLFKRMTDGTLMDVHFTKLHYPCYWHYDILFGLKVMTECGLINDPRCQPALDILESQRLPDGGFPADERYYQTTRPNVSGFSPVSWGGVSRKKMNPFVTVDALAVLKAAGRIQ